MCKDPGRRAVYGVLYRYIRLCLRLRIYTVRSVVSEAYPAIERLQVRAV